MNDKEYAALTKKVRSYIDKWQPILGLNSHRLRIKYIRDSHKHDEYTVAECSPLWQYKSHTIRFYMVEVQDCESDSELEEDILHELVHILVAPAAGNDPSENDAARAAVEYSVQCITFALLWAHEAGEKFAKKGLKNAGNTKKSK